MHERLCVAAWRRVGVEPEPRREVVLSREVVACGLHGGELTASMPPWPCTFPSNDARSRCMRCWTLHDACVEFLASPNASTIYADRPGRGTLSIYQRRAPVRIHVFGMSRHALNTALGNGNANNIGSLRDPLNSEFLRHLERHITLAPRPAAADAAPRSDAGARRLGHRRYTTVRPSEHSAHRRRRRDALLASHNASGANLTMIWPLWEMGFGDVIANTLLPLGELLRMRSMPPTLALSGLRHPPLVQLLRPAVRELCASERPHRHLPRCTSRCWRAVHICAPTYTDTRDAWAALRALDEKAGIAPTEESSAPDGASSLVSDNATVLRVLFAARSGRRLLLNVDALVAACNGSEMERHGRRTRLQCEVLSAQATPDAKARQLRRADVLVCMWGGDTLHGLHLRRGGAIIELRLGGFIMGAPWSWVDMHRRWVMRFNGKTNERPLSFYAVALPTNSSTLTSKDRACIASAGQLARRNPKRNKLWQCYWNVDTSVPYALVHEALTQYASDRARGMKMVSATSGDVCTVRKRGGVLIDGRYTCPL